MLDALVGEAVELATVVGKDKIGSPRWNFFYYDWV